MPKAVRSTDTPPSRLCGAPVRVERSSSTGRGAGGPGARLRQDGSRLAAGNRRNRPGIAAVPGPWPLYAPWAAVIGGWTASRSGGLGCPSPKPNGWPRKNQEICPIFQRVLSRSSLRMAGRAPTTTLRLRSEADPKFASSDRRSEVEPHPSRQPHHLGRYPLHERRGESLAEEASPPTCRDTGNPALGRVADRTASPLPALTGKMALRGSALPKSRRSSEAL